MELRVVRGASQCH